MLSDVPDHLEIGYDSETRKVTLTIVQTTSLQTQISTIQHVLQLEGDEKDNCINQKLLRLVQINQKSMRTQAQSSIEQNRELIITEEAGQTVNALE